LRRDPVQVVPAWSSLLGRIVETTGSSGVTRAPREPQLHRMPERTYAKILHVITDLKRLAARASIWSVVSSLRTFEHVVSCLTLTSDPEGARRLLSERALEALFGVPVDLGVSPDKPPAVRAFTAYLDDWCGRSQHPPLPDLDPREPAVPTIGLARSACDLQPRRHEPLVVELATHLERQQYREVGNLLLANAHAMLKSLSAGLGSPTHPGLVLRLDCDHSSGRPLLRSWPGRRFSLA